MFLVLSSEKPRAMHEKKSKQENGRPQMVPDDQKIYLRQMEGLTITQAVFHRPMYLDLVEVLDIIRAILDEKLQGEIEYFRTVESGVVEEYVVIEKEGVRKNLLFRVWPVLYGHNKRLDYKIYEKGQKIDHLVTYYLSICAKANNVKLVHKK